MSMLDYDLAISLMDEYPDQQDFVGKRSHSFVQAAEKALNLKFPPTYRRFVSEYGAGNFGAMEICGLIDLNFDNSSVPNGIWFTLAERKESGLPNQMIIIYEDGTGLLYCIDSAISNSEGESPIVTFESGRGQSSELVADDFGAFLLEMVQQEIDILSE